MKRSRKILLTMIGAGLIGVAVWFLRPGKPAATEATPAALASAIKSEVRAPNEPAKVNPPSDTPLTLAPAAAAAVTLTVAKSLAAPSQTTEGEPQSTTPSAPATASSIAVVSQENEIAATARMYAAHSSLRTPEVADPDSKANQQILGAMVAKALSQPASLPPTRSSTH